MAAILAGCLIVAFPAASRAAGDVHRINGSAVTMPRGSIAALSLTLAVGGRATGSWFSLCATSRSWCVHNGPLWTALHEVECSAVDGNTWYGGAWLSSGMPGTGWWTFKVVDNGPVGDLVGFSFSETRGAGPCGAGDVPVHAVLAGDFQLEVE